MLLFFVLIYFAISDKIIQKPPLPHPYSHQFSFLFLSLFFLLLKKYLVRNSVGKSNSDGPKCLVMKGYHSIVQLSV